MALLSPFCAFLLAIGPNLVQIVPGIAAGNLVFVLVLDFLIGKKKCTLTRQAAGLTAAAVSKFATLYLLVVKVICGVAAGSLLGKKLGETVLLAPPMLKMLPTMFAWPQLVTALTGGVIALAIVPVLRKALHK